MASTIFTEFAHLQIPLEDIVKATKNFHPDNITGRGGLGTAYRGQLSRSGTSSTKKIAALRLDRGGDIEFWTEISLLSNLKHSNLVSIIGFCYEKHEKIIVTTYQAKGSLVQFLDNPNYLTWTQRLRISVGVARALSYLHHDDEGRGYAVIHLNINSSTVLLDENWEAKLSGFKVSVKQSVNRMDQIVLSDPIGTIGYVDPAIVKTGGVTHKSDIYSFGVVLFELLCGIKGGYFKKNESSNRYLARLAKNHYENKTMRDIIHPDLWKQMSTQSFANYSELAYSCLMEERENRPDANNLIEQLEKVLELQLRHENLGNNFKHLKLRLSDVKLATNNFSETFKIGDVPGYCSEYIAKLNHFDKHDRSSSVKGKNKDELQNVVIKRLLYGNELEEKFYTEIEILTSVEHRNIVTLYGFCDEDSEKILVIENFSNGRLDDYLQRLKDMSILTWKKRLQICIDVAYALDYLHHNQKRVVQGDIDSRSIGLDEHWGAKIVEFPFSRSVGGKYNMNSNVYSFGVILFEILCGRKEDDQIYLKESKEGLPFLARQWFNSGTLEEMIDPIIKYEFTKKSSSLFSGPYRDSFNTFIKIANECVAKTQHHRPTMKVVVKELEKASCIKEEVRVNHQDIYQIYNAVDKAMDKISQQNDQVFDKRQKSSKLQTQIREKNFEHLRIHLRDIQLATENFSEKRKLPLADGYTLYWAKLEHFDQENLSTIEGESKREYPMRRSNVIIKRYTSGNDQYKEEKFFKEIEMLTSVKHPNIVTLLGYCVEESEMVLVTEDLSNLYLGYYFLKEYKTYLRHFTWEIRLKICIDVARALNHLHSEMEDKGIIIINRDISSFNIGLDEKFRARIFEFAHSVLIMPSYQEDKALHLKWIGRPFYGDPEYKRNRELKRESDVYSFGVVLLEVLCGRAAGDPVYSRVSDEGIAYVARRSYKMSKLEDMIDPILKEETSKNSFVLKRGPNKDSLHTFIEIACQCVAETQHHRPTMKIVLEELEKALYFQKNNKDNPKIPLKDIIQATQNFHIDNFIGGGGFGNVFKGTLEVGDGYKTIVAKRLDRKYGQGEKQFLSELQILLEYEHENIIGLVGYCDEKDEKVIIYEYAPRGSLDTYLNDASVSWMQRLNICIDVASALDFIHGGVGKQAKVIHRDIKAENILLNDDLKAKLADFGLSIISPITQETDYVIDDVCGTRGYLDPLYYKFGFLTVESDIYSFGVVLFEILCGRSTLEIHNHEGHYLPDFIKNKFKEGKHDELVFEKIKEEVMPKSLATFQDIAYQCLHLEREKRPTTKKVLTQLKKAREFQLNLDIKFDGVEEESQASIVEVQANSLSSELNNINMTDESRNSEVHSKEKISLDQTDEVAEPIYCWPCGFWKVNATTLSGWLLHLLGPKSNKQTPKYATKEEEIDDVWIEY